MTLGQLRKALDMLVAEDPAAADLPVRVVADGPFEVAAVVNTRLHVEIQDVGGLADSMIRDGTARPS